jgi:hypothetical protein
MNAIKHFLNNWWLLPLILTWPAVSIWRSARRIARLSAAESKVPRDHTREIRTKAPFRRLDFAAKSKIVRKEMAKGTMIAIVILVGFGPSLVLVSRLAPNLPHGALVGYEAIMVVVALGSLLRFAMRADLLARRSGLICPACGLVLTRTYGPRRAQYPIEDHVFETGKCPVCRAQLLDPAEVGPVVEDLQPNDTALWIGICAAMVVVIVVMVYFTGEQTAVNAWNRCRRLYDGAYTASDSAVVDSTKLARNDRACVYFRLQHPT